MNESKSFCPECKQETVFMRAGSLNTCSVCGFHYESCDPRFGVQPEAAGWGFLGAFVKALLLMAAVVVIGLAIWFAGCAIAFGQAF